MWFVAIFGVGFLIVFVGVLFLGWVIQRIRRRPAKRFAKRLLWIGVLLFPVYLLGAVPMFMGWVGSRVIGTRGFEQGYAGPLIDVDGQWQELPSLEGGNTPAVHFESSDGVRLRAFYVPAARVDSPTPTWILVHGLFRNGFELEPVGRMVHELGAAVLLLELRNHGGSGRRPATFGLHESRDVVAAVRWLRDEHDVQNVVLFGVSLGSASVALATPEIDGLAGVVLDAPITDLPKVASMTLSRGPKIPWPVGTLILESLQWWSDFDFEDVRPEDALARLPADVPVLLIGGGEDYRVPRSAVVGLHAELPTRSELKRYWVRDGSRHGKVWVDDPQTYREQLAAFAELLR